ncbi:hypothetical protein PC9H_010621 [Pleurotus ostreatus]|uniref:DUF6534 domain-containing protein n=1 Tax=Pleurotus ostreatus TaxID=5322 RepID=A0A8H6ZK68_PLEOS|nr:uncharacterized protein PC9H_010621 [Pleurotus ostreatus]KAF7422465.1 hypothetical protein PC9H_010621 [Pleurotus ostreatus]
MSPTFDSTLGAAFIGFGFSCLGYGFVLSQIVSYFTRYTADKAVYKFLVVAIWVLETADQMLVGHFVYFYTISNFANPFALLEGTVVWSVILQLTVGALVGTIVKCCFILRVWRCENLLYVPRSVPKACISVSRHNKAATLCLLLLDLTQFALAIVYTIKAFQLGSLVNVYKLRILGIVSLSFGLATDVMIAASLCYFLRHYRTGHSGTDSLVNALSVYAVNTGALTSAVSLSTLLLYWTMPENNFYFIAVYFSLSKFYAISFMATLNTRKIIRGRGSDYSAKDGGSISTNSAIGSTGLRMVIETSSTSGAVELQPMRKLAFAHDEAFIRAPPMAF